MLLEIELYPLKLYSPIFKTHLCSYKTLLITKLIIKENKRARERGKRITLLPEGSNKNKISYFKLEKNN